MRKTINNTFHAIGGAAAIMGVLLMVKAAGMADLGGSLGDIGHNAVCGLSVFAIGLFLGWWKV